MADDNKYTYAPTIQRAGEKPVKIVEVKEAKDTTPQTGDEDNRALIALVLCFLLGIWGVHRFYVGRPVSGIFMILLTLTGIGAIFVFFWVIMDIIRIVTGNFKDKNGNKLKLRA